jgi:ABC-type transport system substrate-binding protein
VLEAFEGYWRKTPSVKRLVMKVLPDEATRLAALKRGEVDIAYSIRSELAEDLQRTPGRSAGAELALLSGAVGPEIAVARFAGAAGRQFRH